MAIEFIQTEMGMGVSEKTRAEAITVELTNLEREIYTKRWVVVRTADVASLLIFNLWIFNVTGSNP